MHTFSESGKPGLLTPAKAFGDLNDAQEWLGLVVSSNGEASAEVTEDARAAYADALHEYLLTIPGREEYVAEIRRVALLGGDVDELLKRLSSLRAIAQERQSLGSLATQDWTDEEVQEWSVPLQVLIETIQQSLYPEREVRQLRYFLRKERDHCAHQMVENVNRGEGSQDQGALLYAFRRTEYLYLKFDEWEKMNVSGERDERAEEDC